MTMLTKAVQSRAPDSAAELAGTAIWPAGDREGDSCEGEQYQTSGGQDGLPVQPLSGDVCE